MTDEDRDITSSDTYASVLAELTRKQILLNAIVDNGFSADGSQALGVTEDNSILTGYLADGAGDFTNSITNVSIGSGWGTTTADYVDLAIETSGAAWDLNQLRAGGFTADSFASAFLDIKVSEIVTQTPSSVPLPGSVWLMAAAFGGTAALRRRKARAV